MSSIAVIDGSCRLMFLSHYSSHSERQHWGVCQPRIFVYVFCLQYRYFTFYLSFQIDSRIQYGEDLDVKTRDFDYADEEDEQPDEQ